MLFHKRHLMNEFALSFIPSAVFVQNKYVSLEHKSSVKTLGYICSNSQQYIIWVKIIDFSFMPKIIRILRSCSMKICNIFSTVNISKLNY